jgi:hypothetical protein
MLSMFHYGFHFNIRSPNISTQAAQQGLVCFKISMIGQNSEAQIDHIAFKLVIDMSISFHCYMSFNN